MTRPTVVLRRAIVLAFAATLLLAVPASAHPYIQGGEAPVDSLANLVLDLAHGCAIDDGGHSHGEGPEEPTTEVALEVHEQMRIVDVPDVDGFDVDLETDDDGNVEVVVWTATTSTDPAPELPFDAVFSGEPGDELYLRVFQGCEDLSSRWVGTPDEPADEPAVRLLLVEADPDNPPPPEEELAGGDAAPDEDDEAAAAPTEDATAEEDGVDEGGTEDDEADDPAAEEPAETQTAPATVPDDTQDSPLLWIIVVLVAAALLLAAILALRRRPVAAVSPHAIEGDDVDGATTAAAPGRSTTADATQVDPTMDRASADDTTVGRASADDPTVVDGPARSDGPSDPDDQGSR
jgi:hypothetical protein